MRTSYGDQQWGYWWGDPAASYFTDHRFRSSSPWSRLTCRASLFLFYCLYPTWVHIEALPISFPCVAFFFVICMTRACQADKCYGHPTASGSGIEGHSSNWPQTLSLKVKIASWSLDKEGLPKARLNLYCLCWHTNNSWLKIIKIPLCWRLLLIKHNIVTTDKGN